MIMRLHVVSEQFLCCVTISAPWRNASLFNMCICNGALYESTHVFSLSFFNDAHAAEYSLLGFMVWLVEVFCYIKARWQAARLSVNYSGNLGICSLVLDIVCKLLFIWTV